MSVEKSKAKHEFGFRLRTLRFALGREDPKTGKLEPISQEDMAALVGVDRAAWQKNENHGSMPKIDVLQTLVTKGFCGPGYLLMGWPDNPSHISGKIKRAVREQSESPPPKRLRTKKPRKDHQRTSPDG